MITAAYASIGSERVTGNKYTHSSRTRYMGFFFTIPVPMIKRLFINPDAYNEFIHAGGYLSAKRVSSYEEEDVIKHLTYCWYRQKNALTQSLIFEIEKSLDEDLLEDDYGLFGSDGAFDEMNIYDTDLHLGAFANLCRENPDFFKKVKDWHDVYIFHKECGLTIKGNVIAETIRIGRSLPDYGQDYPYAIIKPNFLIQYRDKNKTERARAEMAMLLAINSITGKQEWAGTTRGFIIARMFGAKKVDELEQALQGRTAKETKQLEEAFKTYTTRKRFESMRDKLMARGLLKCWVPFSHRIFVSPTKKFEEIENDVLVFIKRKSSPTEQIKSDKARLLNLLDGEG